MKPASIDGTVGTDAGNWTLAGLVSQPMFDFAGSIIFSRSYPEQGQHYDMAGRPVKAELVISRVNGSIEFEVRIRYSETNKPVLMELKTKKGGLIDHYDPELEETDNRRLIGQEVNYADFLHVEFSFKGLKSFAVANGIEIANGSYHDELLAKASQIRKEISNYWKSSNVPKKEKVTNTAPMWKEVDELKSRARTVYVEEVLRKAGHLWLATFPGKLREFIENDGRAAGQGRPYLQNFVRSARIPRMSYIGLRYL